MPGCQGRIAGSYGKDKLKLLEATTIGIIAFTSVRKGASCREEQREVAAAVLLELQDEWYRRSLGNEDSTVERGASDGDRDGVTAEATRNCGADRRRPVRGRAVTCPEIRV